LICPLGGDHADTQISRERTDRGQHISGLQFVVHYGIFDRLYDLVIDRAGTVFINKYLHMSFLFNREIQFFIIKHSLKNRCYMLFGEVYIEKQSRDPPCCVYPCKRGYSAQKTVKNCVFQKEEGAPVD